VSTPLQVGLVPLHVLAPVQVVAPPLPLEHVELGVHVFPAPSHVVPEAQVLPVVQVVPEHV
jgi:hypothetical protein